MTRQLVAVLGVGVVPADERVVTADDSGLNRGDGVFDAARVVADGDGVRVDFLTEHLERFARSHAKMGMRAPDLDAWRALVASATAAWDVPGEAMLKLLATRGCENAPDAPGAALLTLTALSGEPCRPLRVVTRTTGRAADAFADAPWLLGGVKSLSYGVNMAAGREAKSHDADDVLFVSSDGFCLEGPRSGFIVRFGDEYVTTPVGATGILDSVTVAVVGAGLRARGLTFTERLVTPEQVQASDGAWLLAAIRGISPITSLDGVPLATDAQASTLLRNLGGWA